MAALATQLDSILKLSNASAMKTEDLGPFLAILAAPQVLAHLISEDYSCSLPAAAHMAWLSEPYGLREFPMDISNPTFIRLRNICIMKDSILQLALWSKGGAAELKQPSTKVVKQAQARPIPYRTRGSCAMASRKRKTTRVLVA